MAVIFASLETYKMSCYGQDVLFPAQMNTGFPACIARKVKITLILHYYTETVLLMFQFCTTDVMIIG